MVRWGSGVAVVDAEVVGWVDVGGMEGRRSVRKRRRGVRAIVGLSIVETSIVVAWR